MTQADFGILLIVSFFFLLILLITVGFTLYVWLGPYQWEGRKTQRYKLFAVRDALIWLVVEGKLSEDDEFYQSLYRAVNQALHAVSPIRLSDALSQLKDGFLAICLLHSVEDPSVRKVRINFLLAINNILRWRSPLVEMGSTLTSLRITHSSINYIPIHHSRLLLSKIFRAQGEAYRLYEDVNSMTKKLAI